jgi:hypothetical protein
MEACFGRPVVRQIRDCLLHGRSSKLQRRAGVSGFRHITTNRMLRGLTGLLQEKLFGEQDVTVGVCRGSGRRRRSSGAWSGRKRGIAVDAQLTRIINGKKKPPSRLYNLTSHCLSAFRNAKLRPVIAQYPVSSVYNRVGSAADVIALDEDDRLVVVEMKCGYHGDRSAVSYHPGTRREQHMRGVLSMAVDCVFHRHLCQLSATVAMLLEQQRTVGDLTSMGVRGVTGLLVYLDGHTAELVPLPAWWQSRGECILDYLKVG